MDIDQKIKEIIDGVRCMHSFEETATIRVEHTSDEKTNISRIEILISSLDPETNNKIVEKLDKVIDNLNTPVISGQEKPTSEDKLFSKQSTEKRKYSLKEFVDFDTAKQILKDHNITQQKDYFSKRKSGEYPELQKIPRNPERYYSEWKSWFDFVDIVKTKKTKINKGSTKGRKYTRVINKLTYQEAKDIVAKLGIESSSQYNKISKEKRVELGLPSTPRLTFKKDWTGWDDFLGRKK